MPEANEAISFYFFDFDDNIMFLGTPILIRNTETLEQRSVSTGEFANIHPVLGQPGEWEDYATFAGSFRHFRDITSKERDAGQQEYFVRDVEEAIQGDATRWQGPSWDLFVHACQEQRPVSVVTARGHSAETLQAGIRVLVDRGLIPSEPNYLTVFPVGNDDIRREQLGDTELEMTTPALKKRAIIQTVERALSEYGSAPEHSFGMSDDDPKNVQLAVRAMLVCKKRYADKRFFVINTHRGEEVKVEVLVYDSPAL